MSESMVSIQHLEKAFGDNVVLRDVNIEIQKGEVVVVLGPSGSGKSTMLRCINLLEKPTGGHIFIEGAEITDPKTNVDKLREHVGMVFQQLRENASNLQRSKARRERGCLASFG